MRHKRLHSIKRKISTVAEGLAAAFRPRMIKNAFRSVTFNGRQYLCFYLALLLVQTGFWTLSLTTDCDMRARQERIVEQYDYHFEIVNLDEAQMTDAYNALEVRVSKAERGLLIKSFSVLTEADGTYTIRVVSAGETQDEVAGTLSMTERILRTHIPDGWIVNTSPLFAYETDYRAPVLAAFWSIAVGWLALGLGVVIILYLIRLDHFRFTYGIYMTCGADFPMLYGTAASELLAVSLMTFLPSGLVGLGITAALYLPRGVGLALTWRTAVAVPLLCLAVVLLSVGLPMYRLSKQPPLRHIVARDNAHLVSSPRRSLRLFDAAFPRRYELATLWRMRKYYLRLLVSAVLFAACFVTGLYIANMQRDMASLPEYEYTVTYDAGFLYDEDGAYIGNSLSADELDILRTDADYFLPHIEAIPGVDHVWWKAAQTGGWYNAHLLIKPDQTGTGVGEHAVPSSERQSDGYTMAMRNYEYTAVDKAWLDTLVSHGLCEVEGDPYLVLTDPHAVILTEDVYNTAAFDFHPGDKVTVAKWLRFNGVIDRRALLDPRELLRQQIAKSEFQYEEFTVCAVLRGLPAAYNITFGVSFDVYRELTGEPAVRNSFEVYIKDGTDDATVRAADPLIRRAVREMGDWQVRRTGNYFRAGIQSERNGDGLTVVLGSLLLLISPLVWLFSQIMFYFKRRGELDLLHALGAPGNTLPRLFRLTGGILSGLAFLVTVALSALCNWLVYMLVTVVLPLLHITEAVSYDYKLSLPALIACVAVSVVCGFLSCEVPYRLIRRRAYTQRRDY